MKKVSGIVNGLKFVLKYAVYVMAIIKIVEFAISTLNEIEEQKIEKDAKVISE
jgi:hypothetical protein